MSLYHILFPKLFDHKDRLQNSTKATFLFNKQQWWLENESYHKIAEAWVQFDINKETLFQVNLIYDGYNIYTLHPNRYK